MGPPSPSLAPHPFLYTPDQIGQILTLKDSTIKRWLFFEGRSTGVKDHTRMRAINVAPAGEVPVWRVEEHELVRWMRHKGIRLYQYRVKEDE